jgi:hypothetical protein
MAGSSARAVDIVRGFGRRGWERPRCKRGFLVAFSVEDGLRGRRGIHDHGYVAGVAGTDKPDFIRAGLKQFFPIKRT